MPVVEIIQQQDLPTPDTINILFLGDGFSATDEDLFNVTVRQVSDRLLRKVRPFNLPGIREQFSIFAAFTPSTESGISCQAHIDESGKVIQGSGGELKQKASRFMLAYGYPPGDPGNHFSQSIHPLGWRNDITLPQPYDDLVPDFVSTLTHPTEPVGSSVIPGCWEPGGNNEGLVVVLVNDDPYGAKSHDAYIAVSLGREDAFNLTSATSPADHIPATPRQSWNRIASQVAHELGLLFQACRRVLDRSELVWRRWDSIFGRR